MATRAEKWRFFQSNRNLSRSGGQSFSAEALAVIDSFPNALTAGEDALIAAFVDSMNGRGDWLTRDAFIHHGMQDADNALWDWRRLSAATAVNAPTHTPGVSYGFNGSTQYIDSLIDLSTFGGSYKLNDALIGAFVVQNNNLSITSALCGSSSTLPMHSYIINAGGSNQIWSQINQTPTASRVVKTMSNDSLYIGARTTSTINQIYENGIDIGGEARASGSITIGNVGIGCRLEDTTSPLSFFNGALSSFVCGSAIGFDHVNYNADLRTLNAGLAAL